MSSFRRSRCRYWKETQSIIPVRAAIERPRLLREGDKEILERRHDKQIQRQCTSNLTKGRNNFMATDFSVLNAPPVLKEKSN